MGLELDKYRNARHTHLAVAGSYTDSFIHVQGHSSTSSDGSAFIQWVPNNKDQYTSTFSGVNSAYLNSDGYVELKHANVYGQNGYGILRWDYLNTTNSYDGSNTSPGIRDKDFMFFGSTVLNEFADYLNDLMNGVYGPQVWAIYSYGSISSNSNLANAFAKMKSWRHSRVLGGSTSTSTYSYAAVATNVNDIGLLSESIQGPKLGHTNAITELAIEHEETTLGHAGYGEELSSGAGAGIRINSTPNSTQTIGPKYVYWNSNNHYNTSQNEYIRISGGAKIGQYARYTSGYVKIKLTESGFSPQYFTSQSVDALEKFEFNYRRQSATSSNLAIEALLYTGSGTGSGITSSTAELRDLEVYKCGLRPDQQRDVAVHKWHVNALNVNESPADFKMGDPDSFLDFYASDRNLVDTSIQYTLDTSGMDSGAKQYMLNNFQYRGGRSYPYGDSQFVDNNWVHWFNRDLQTTNTSSGQFQVKEVYDLLSNQTSFYPFYEYNGIQVDHTKMYVSGVWVRVRKSVDTGQNYAPNRISLMAGAKTNSGANATLYTANGFSNGATITDHYCTSIDYQGINGSLNEWKLMTAFYLPSWMSDARTLDFSDIYRGLWAGEYEFGNGILPGSQDVNTSYGLSTNAINGKVARMSSDVHTILPRIKTELYSGTGIWLEMAFPFVTEIDPMNVTRDGNAFFWDFQEI